MSSGKGRQDGFTYVAMLLAVAGIGAGLAATSEVWSQTRQREKEAELLWIGEQFRQAIGLYYQRSPGALKRYPEKLEDLLLDRRHLSTQRYLRRIYSDPLTGKASWGLVTAPGGGVMGVYSLVQGRPVRTAGVSLPGSSARAARYADWRFVYEPPVAASAVSPRR